MARQIADLTEGDISHYAGGYGIELAGKTSTERREVLTNRLSEPVAVVDGSTVESGDEFLAKAVEKVTSLSETPPGGGQKGSIALRRLLEGTGASIVISRFDQMSDDTRTAVARHIKGLAEQLDNDEVMIGFGVETNGVVTQAEPDLSMRVLPVTLEE